MSKKKSWFNPTKKSSSGYNNWGYEGWGKKTYGMFQNEMTGTTAVFGRDKGIQVSFSGEQTFAKDNVINFPNLDISTELDNTTLTICRGFVDHHSAKIRFSDRELVNKTQDETEKKKPLLWNLFNAIESVRTESKYIDTYPGSKKNLAEMSDEQAISFKRDNMSSAMEKMPLSKTAPMAIASAARKNMGYFGFGISDIGFLLGKDDKDKVSDWVERIDDCEGTDDSLSLAKEIYEALKDDSEEEKEQEQDGDSEQKQQFQYMPNSEGAVQKVLAECKSEYGDKGTVPPYKVYTYDHDKVHHWSDPHPGERAFKSAAQPYHHYAGSIMGSLGNISKYMRVVDKLGPTINVARRKLELMIAAQRRVEWDYIKERGKFDSKRMCAAIAGDVNVFKTKENAADIDTAVSIVIDMSGSMVGEKRYVALETAVVLFECFSKIGIPFEISGFDCTFSGKDREEVQKIIEVTKTKSLMKSSGSCARYEAIHNYVFKAFKDRPFDARPYLMGLEDPPVGRDERGEYVYEGVGTHNNTDGESIMIAHNRLAARPERRKIMFVLSDGQPSTTCIHDSQPINYLKKVVADIERKGTNIVGIGICTSCVEQFYSKFVVCYDARDLTGDMLKLLSDLLLDNKKEVA